MATMVFQVYEVGDGQVISGSMSKAEAKTMLKLLEMAGEKLQEKLREAESRLAYRVIDDKVIDAARLFRKA